MRPRLKTAFLELKAAGAVLNDTFFKPSFLLRACCPIFGHLAGIGNRIYHRVSPAPGLQCCLGAQRRARVAHNIVIVGIGSGRRFARGIEAVAPCKSLIFCARARAGSGLMPFCARQSRPKQRSQNVKKVDFGSAHCLYFHFSHGSFVLVTYYGSRKS